MRQGTPVAPVSWEGPPLTSSGRVRRGSGFLARSANNIVLAQYISDINLMADPPRKRERLAEPKDSPGKPRCAFALVGRLLGSSRGHLAPLSPHLALYTVLSELIAETATQVYCEPDENRDGVAPTPSRREGWGLATEVGRAGRSNTGTGGPPVPPGPLSPNFAPVSALPFERRLLHRSGVLSSAEAALLWGA